MIVCLAIINPLFAQEELGTFPPGTNVDSIHASWDSLYSEPRDFDENIITDLPEEDTCFGPFIDKSSMVRFDNHAVVQVNLTEPTNTGIFLRPSSTNYDIPPNVTTTDWMIFDSLPKDMDFDIVGLNDCLDTVSIGKVSTAQVDPVKPLEVSAKLMDVVGEYHKNNPLEKDIVEFLLDRNDISIIDVLFLLQNYSKSEVPISPALLTGSFTYADYRDSLIVTLTPGTPGDGTGDPGDGDGVVDVACYCRLLQKNYNEIRPLVKEKVDRVNQLLPKHRHSKIRQGTLNPFYTYFYDDVWRGPAKFTYPRGGSTLGAKRTFIEGSFGDSLDENNISVVPQYAYLDYLLTCNTAGSGKSDQCDCIRTIELDWNYTAQVDHRSNTTWDPLVASRFASTISDFAFLARVDDDDLEIIDAGLLNAGSSCNSEVNPDLFITIVQAQAAVAAGVLGASSDTGSSAGAGLITTVGEQLENLIDVVNNFFIDNSCEIENHIRPLLSSTLTPANDRRWELRMGNRTRFIMGSAHRLSTTFEGHTNFTTKMASSFRLAGVVTGGEGIGEHPVSGEERECCGVNFGNYVLSNVIAHPVSVAALRGEVGTFLSPWVDVENGPVNGIAPPVKGHYGNYTSDEDLLEDCEFPIIIQRSSQESDDSIQKTKEELISSYIDLINSDHIGKGIDLSIFDMSGKLLTSEKRLLSIEELSSIFNRSALNMLILHVHIDGEFYNFKITTP